MNEFADAWADLKRTLWAALPFERMVARWPWAGIAAYVLLGLLLLAAFVSITWDLTHGGLRG